MLSRLAFVVSMAIFTVTKIPKESFCVARMNFSIIMILSPDDTCIRFVWLPGVLVLFTEISSFLNDYYIF